MHQPLLKIFRLPHGADLDLPAYQTAGAAGMDLSAAIDEDIVLQPGQRCIIPCGMIIAIEPGFEGQVRPRSGLALKHGIGMPNTPGTIDSDYRGELKVILINFGQADFRITRGMRIAQLVITPVAHAAIELVDSAEKLSSTDRGGGGFGSTGI
ncbi:MAG: dUTP diphosphatase [Phycisphaerae bacterium]